MEKNALDIIGHAEEHLIERIAENMHTFGMPATLGRVLGIIYMNRKPMTLNELSEAPLTAHLTSSACGSYK